MTSLDALVTRFRLWLEDRLPWYDRQREQDATERIERMGRKSERIREQAELAQQRFRR